MVPRFLSRRIGSVSVFEVQGVFTEPWIMRIKEEMTGTLERDPTEGLLFNMREVEKVDRSGAETVLEIIRKPSKAGIWGRNLTVCFLAEHMNPREAIPIFQRASEAIGYFGREFVRGEENTFEERRRLPRTKTALSGEFEREENGETFLFETVITNLSRGGLYGYFLDSKTEELAQRILDPFDLKMIKVRVWFPDEKLIEVEGKVLRREKGFLENQGMAVEFYDLRSEDQEKLRQFLEG